MSPLLAGRVILVTGASRGLGAALAVACAAEGARLVLTARTRGALEEVDDRVRAAGGEPATLVPLDLAKPELVDPLGPAVHQRHGRLDGFAACAADLGTLGPTAQVDPKTFARVLAVNLHANARLIRTLDPLLRASDAGRAVVGEAFIEGEAQRGIEGAGAGQVGHWQVDEDVLHGGLLWGHPVSLPFMARSAKRPAIRLLPSPRASRPYPPVP